MNQILDFQNKNNKNWMDGKEKKPNIYNGLKPRAMLKNQI